VFCTKEGIIKKTVLSAFKNVRRKGIKAIKLREDDTLVETHITDGDDEIIIATHNGLAVRFHEEQVGSKGRDTMGVKGVTLNEGDFVVSMSVVKPGDMLLTVSENGYGKISSVDDYRKINRGGKGVITLKTTERNGGVIAVRKVLESDELVVVSTQGKVIRIKVNEIRVTGRNAAGVRIMDLRNGDKVTALQPVALDETEEDFLEDDDI